MDHRVGGDIAAGAHSILDDEGPAKPLREPLRNQARQYVGRAAGSQADDRTHRADRIGLRPGEARYGSDRGHLQECATGKFHGAPLTDVENDLRGSQMLRHREAEDIPLSIHQIKLKIDIGCLQKILLVGNGYEIP